MSLRVLRGTAVWRTTAYATQSRWQLFLTIPPAGGRFEGSGSQSEEEDSRTGYGATSAVTWITTHGEVTVEAESRWDQSDYQNYFTTSRARDSVATLVSGRQLSGALFVESRVDVTERCGVDLGIRYDALGTRSTPDSGNIVSATHGILSPKLGTLVRVTPALTPTTAWAYETGLKVDHDGATGSVALIRTALSNEQTLNLVTLVSTNGGASRRQGLELDWQVPVTRVITTSGAGPSTMPAIAVWSPPRERVAGTPVLDGQRRYNTAAYVGAAALDMRPPAGALRLRVSGNWIKPYSPFDEPGVRVGGYGMLHLSATLPYQQMEFSVGLRNLLDRTYPALIAGHIVSPGRPRSLEVTATLRGQ